VDNKTANFWMVSIKQRLLSLGLVLATGFVLLTSLVVNAGLSAAESYINNVVPKAIILLESINVVLPFCIITFRFALVFKFVPDTSFHGAMFGWGLWSPPFSLRLESDHRILFGPFSLIVCVRCGGISRDLSNLDLLLCSNLAIRSGTDSCLRA
jgi:hypothetical protein